MLQHDATALAAKLDLQCAADVAVKRGAAGRILLPPDLHASFDLILQAFRHYEAGRDDDARAALQNISLQSPFLEWKVLLRGLLAYYTNDDARALENWRRLDPARLPSKLCAALRAGIDPDYLNAQIPAVQAFLKTKVARQQGGAIASKLRELGISVQKENLAPAFRKAESLLKQASADFPDLGPRLANIFFWAVVDHGEPEDFERYMRVFGRPADDPELFRFEALCMELRGFWPEAHKVWQNFIENVAHHPEAWPGEIGTRVRAMIWTRMAENALPQRRRRGHSGNPFFDMFAQQSAPLKPSAEQCYENALKLSPERLECYLPLFELYRKNRKLAKAKKLGQQMLKRFPEHADMLEALGELSLESKDFKKAQEYFEKSIQANPLDRGLRRKLARARQNFGLALTLAGKFDQARTHYENALQLWEGPKTPLLCQWAIAERKADNAPRADELIAQALAEPDQRLACRYALVGESVRADLPAKAKKAVAADLKAALAEAPTPAEILVLLESAADQRKTHADTFRGQKGQEQAIVRFLGALDYSAFNEGQMQRVVIGLQTLNARRAWHDTARDAQGQYPRNPFFSLSLVDYHLTSPRGPHIEAVSHPLETARKCVQQMPRGELQERYLDTIKEKDRYIAELKSRNPSFMDVLDHMFGDMDDEEADESW